MNSDRQEEKSNIEIAEVEEFLDALGMNPDSISKGDDPPDVVVTHDGNKIAIEHTRFHTSGTVKTSNGNKVSTRNVDSAWAKLKKSITDERQKHQPQFNNLNCYLCFKNRSSPPGSKHADFIKELFQFITDNQSVISEKAVMFTEYDTDRFSLLNKYLSKIQINRVDFYIIWDSNLAAGSVGLNEKELCDIIRKKSNWVSPTEYDEAWLLIVSNYRVSEAIGIVGIERLNEFETAKTLLSNCPYERVFIHNRSFKKLFAWYENGWHQKR